MRGRVPGVTYSAGNDTRNKESGAHKIGVDDKVLQFADELSSLRRIFACRNEEHICGNGTEKYDSAKQYDRLNRKEVSLIGNAAVRRQYPFVQNIQRTDSALVQRHIRVDRSGSVKGSK